MEQKQWQGMERRQSQGQYQGENRRKAQPMFDEPAGNPGQSTQERKDEQQERTRQQARDQTDTH